MVASLKVNKLYSAEKTKAMNKKWITENIVFCNCIPKCQNRVSDIVGRTVKGKTILFLIKILCYYLLMEGETNYERVIDGTEEEKDIARKVLQETFDARSKKLSKYEIEKTPEDLELIKKTESIVDEMITGYGCDTKPIPLDHIYILKPGDVYLATEGRLREGIHQPLGLNIGVEKQKSKLLFASTIAHELFHLKSYKSARVGESGEDVRLYRSGFSMFDRKNSDVKSGDEKEYFAMLEEAIVAECAKKFLEKIEKDPMFSEEVEARKMLTSWVSAFYIRNGAPEEKIRELENELDSIDYAQDRVKDIIAFSDNEIQRQAYAAGMLRSAHEKGKIKWHERYRERKKLEKVLDEIVEKSNGRFKSKDEIFDEFAKANFSGNYLSVAKIVENILGKGAFRKLAEEFSLSPKI
jgi:hypothetical protein